MGPIEISLLLLTVSALGRLNQSHVLDCAECGTHLGYQMFLESMATPILVLPITENIHVAFPKFP